MKRTRLDQLLVERGLVPSRSQAQALVLAGAVRVDGTVATRAALPITDTSDITITERPPYVSRGGYKLAHSLDTFGLDPAGLIALDAGACTGGFTDVLLQRGAAAVYAVDVGYGVLDWRLRQDPRVIVLERTNIRYLQALPPLPHTPAQTAPLTDCATIDVSFISLALVLPAVRQLIHEHAWVVALVKPQFEAGREHVGKRGVVRDPAMHRQVLQQVTAAAAQAGFGLQGITRSPLTGPAGNREFLAWWQPESPSIDVAQAIACSLT